MPELPCDSAHNRDGMSKLNGDLAKHALRFVEDAQLFQDRASVVIDSFACQTVVLVEAVDTAKRELDSSSG